MFACRKWISSNRAVTLDDRGAIMVMAVFFSVFLVALLFAVVGTGRAIFMREHFQDSVDGAVLSSAVLSAQALNLIVLANVVMAALLAILVALKAIEALCSIAIAICTATAWMTAGASLSAIPFLNDVRSTTKSIHSELKEPIFTAIEVLHDVSDQVASFAPELAKQGAEARLLQGDYPAKQGMIYGKADSLPVEDDDYGVLCAKSGGVVCRVVTKPFSGSGLTDEIVSACEEVAGELSDWFCDDSGGNGGFPITREQSVLFPQTEETRACEQNGDAKACQWVQDAEPDEAGFCRAGVDCAAYERFVAEARKQCQPDDNTSFERYSYQIHEAHVTYRFDGEDWVRGTPHGGSYHVVKGQEAPPCASDEDEEPSVAVGYRIGVHPANSSTVVLPVCTNEEPPEVTSHLTEGDEHTVEFTEVTQILGCVKTEEYTVVLEKDEDESASNSEGREPKRIASAVSLGSEAFLFRAVASRTTDDSSVRAVIDVARWGNVAKSSELEALAWLTQFSYAQAEYFYDGDEGQSSWMWNMKWRARLRRMRMPTADEEQRDFSESCQDKVGANCGRLIGDFFVPNLAGH